MIAGLLDQVTNLKKEIGDLKYPDWENTPILSSGEIEHDGEGGTWKHFWLFKDDLTTNQIKDFLSWMGVLVDGYRPCGSSCGDCSGKVSHSPIRIIPVSKEFTLVVQSFTTDI